MFAIGGLGDLPPFSAICIRTSGAQKAFLFYVLWEKLMICEIYII